MESTINLNRFDLTLEEWKDVVEKFILNHANNDQIEMLDRECEKVWREKKEKQMHKFLEEAVDHVAYLKTLYKMNQAPQFLFSDEREKFSGLCAIHEKYKGLSFFKRFSPSDDLHRIYEEDYKELIEYLESDKVPDHFRETLKENNHNIYRVLKDRYNHSNFSTHRRI